MHSMWTIVTLILHGVFGQTVPTNVPCSTAVSSKFPNLYPDFSIVKTLTSRISEWPKIEFENCKVHVAFYCNASYPIEWVEERYDQNIDALTDVANHIKKNIWSDRVINEGVLQEYGNISANNPELTTYLAFLSIKTSEKSPCVAANYTCRSVSDHCLQSRVVSIVDSSKRTVTYERSTSSYVEDECNKTPQNVPCDTVVEVALDKEHGRFGWRCTSSLKNFTVVPHLRTCDAAIHCNSYFNHYKNQNCVKRIPSESKCDECLFQNRSAGYLRHAGHIFCGDRGQNVVLTAAHYFFSIVQGIDSKEIPDLYLHWHEANPQKMLYLEPIHGDIYLGETKTVICKVSRYYFSFGHRFGFEYKNGTMEYSPSLDGIHDLSENVNRMNISVDFTSLELKRIYCFAPVWNSTLWVNQSFAVDVKNDALRPSFLDEDGIHTQYRMEKVTFDLHQMNANLSCRVFGIPAPETIWIYKFKDGMRIEEVTGQDGSKVLVFQHVTDATAGEYVCEATNFLGNATKVFSVRVRDRFTEYVLASTILGVIFVLVFMAVVGRCWLKVKQQKNLLRTMTDAEVIKFREGNLDFLKNSEYLDTQELLHALPYNDEYEIPSRCLYVDPSEILGSGNFGQVLKGTFYDKNDRMKCKVVAVKTTKPKYDFAYFQTLLTEVKIMAYIGKHTNIVGLVGACTTNIKKGQIYIAVEYCAKGSMEKFLKNHRTAFINTLCGKYITTSFCGVDGLAFDTTSTELSVAHLLKWSREIANGMEFLESKKIVHGDLAARNVLLTSNLVAKVGDFGLSRVIMTYSNYIRSTQEECFLAFKWMAPETLQELKFSAMSDVWSFGVTLWEIFSLAQHPYPGTTYNSDFLEWLQSGHRLNKPAFANSQIYNLMMDCWQFEPSQRVTFTDIKDFFENLLMQTCNEEYVQTKSENDTSQYVNGSHNLRVHNPGYTMLGGDNSLSIDENTISSSAEFSTATTTTETLEDSQGYLQPLLINFKP